MSNSDLAIIILAAGKGTRMKSDSPKVMHTLAGKPMINWLIETSEQLNPKKIITVIGPDMPALEEAVAPHETAIQKDRNGTGGAVKCALPTLKDFKGKVLILMGDEPLVELSVLKALAENDGLAVQGFDTLAPAGLGRMLLNQDGTLDKIVEDRDCSDEQKRISLCNAGNYCVPAEHLEGWINQIGNDNAQGEYYLTDLPAIAVKDGHKTQVVRSNWIGPWGINDRIQLAFHEKLLQVRLREKALLEGVSMIDPDSVTFHHDTKIAAGAVVDTNVFFGPEVTIESGVHIKSFCHLEGTHVKAGTTVGPFARLRPGSEISEDVKIGNFVEIKKSSIGKGSKISHLAYVGDTDMGENVNFSCGAITVNYDGFDKHKTKIGNNVMVGSNVNLVAPVILEDGAFAAAGSTITKDVDADSLAISRIDTDVKKGWAARFRKIKNAAKIKMLFVMVLVASSPSQACEGFKNSMTALEAAVANHQIEQQRQAQNQKPTLPHLRSLNEDLDALEKAVADYHAQKARQQAVPAAPSPKM